MRVTNSMIFGNSLNNIHRNVRHVNDLVRQIETKKRIGRPSDDPILAARSLRYRTILEETEQFLSNANGGLAWMRSSESAFMNMLYYEDSALQEINRRLVAAADGSHELSDRLAMVTEMREFFDQIALEMNQAYMGRYVFSGFFTNQPPVLTTDMERSFIITQQIHSQNIMSLRSFQNLPPAGRQPVVHEINVINLPYRDLDPNTLEIPGFHILSFDIMDENAYQPAATVGDVRALLLADPNHFGTPPLTIPADVSDETPILHFIPARGELVMHNDTVTNFPRTVDVTYRLDSPRAGELNPVVYFYAREIDPTTGNFLEPLSTHTFNTSDHQIRMEMAAGNHVTVNALASEVFTPAMFADLRALFEAVEAVHNTASSRDKVVAYFEDLGHLDDDLANEVERFMTNETGRIQSVMHDRFSVMLGHFTSHVDIVQREHASLGSRMNTIDMLVVRLEEEEISYTALLSANEDTPLQDAIMRKNMAEAAFQAALRANAMTVQLSLVNFLR
ncbi:MAG: hypothetical protein FWC16_00240 [Defluviitaleaceae bacterium]|nr:hypothetical protein [Defluviitaleaceae bacterium]MCL2273331.1 hypothetical protein [Defluviitaleaceae bacterium]